jgi:tetratricopeptide (TPR) repeat protein
MSEHALVVGLIDAVSLERHGSARVAAWLAEHRTAVPAALRTCDQDELREVGLRLAAATWTAADLLPDPRWWTDVATAGESLAIAGRDPVALVDLLHSAATTFARHGDQQRAEERLVRALAIARRTGGRQNDAVLTALAGLYRDWGRLGKALDAYLGLVDLRREAGDPAGTAAALAEVGATMHAAGRLRTAMEYFDRADEEIADAPATETSHARILVWCGRTRWEQGLHSDARRRWSRALALLVDVDDTAANEVRELLANGPAERTQTSNTSWSSSGGVG